MWEEFVSLKENKQAARTEEIHAEEPQPSLERKLWLQFVLLLLLFELQIKARKEASLDYVQNVSTLFRAGGNIACSPPHTNTHTQLSGFSIPGTEEYDEPLAREKTKLQMQIKKYWWLNYRLEKQTLSGDKYRLYLMYRHVRCLKLSHRNVQITHNSAPLAELEELEGKYNACNRDGQAMQFSLWGDCPLLMMYGMVIYQSYHNIDITEQGSTA